MALVSLTVENLRVMLRPDPGRTVLRPFMPADTPLAGHAAREHRDAVIDRVQAMPEAMVVATCADLLRPVIARHNDAEAVLDRRFDQIAADHPGLTGLGIDRRRLIGACFTEEYAFEAAALFNPCMIAHPDQTGMAADTLRFILSLRAVGEGHVSSVIFRTGSIGPGGDILVDPPGSSPIDAAVTTRDGEGLRLDCAAGEDLSGVVLFPASRAHRHGIEDLRMTAFQDGMDRRYLGTLTGVGTEGIRQEILTTRDFRTFDLYPIEGPYAATKGMALFPRRILKFYAALGRPDHETLWLMTSDDLRRWDGGIRVVAPAYPWEAIQLGNCGSPIELPEGWLVLTHGVGPMRSYAIGACLLDRANPTRLLGRLSFPLIAADSDHWAGFVPNSVYSCGGLVHRDMLYIPYGVADSFATFARVGIAALLGAMTPC